MTGNWGRWRWLLAVLLLVGSTVSRAEDPAKLVNPSDSYVADFANVLDEGSKAQLQAICTEVHDKAGATIKVVTVQTLDGMDLSDFSIRLAENWKVGAKDTDRGLIFLVAMKERKDRIEVGYGLEGILNDAKVGDIRRSMHDQFAAGQYGQALVGGVQQVANVIAADKGVTLDQQPQADEEPARPARHGHAQPSPVGTIFRILFFLFVLFIIFRGGRGGGGGSGLGWFLLGNMMGGGGGRNNWGGGDSGGGSWGGGSGGGGGDSGGGFGGGGAGGNW